MSRLLVLHPLLDVFGGYYDLVRAILLFICMNVGLVRLVNECLNKNTDNIKDLVTV